jgi:hypothetical protein
MQMEVVYVQHDPTAWARPFPGIHRRADLHGAVEAMLHGIETDQPIFFMVDQMIVPVGVSHRRPGAHVDGFWFESIHAHGSGGGGHGTRGPAPPFSPPSPREPQLEPWRVPDRGHGSGGHGTRGAAGLWDVPDHWNRSIDRPHDMPIESIILASDVFGARAYEGEFFDMKHGGDCSHVDVSKLRAIDLVPGRAWAGHALTTLHESVPVPATTRRTVVRLNVKGWVH